MDVSARISGITYKPFLCRKLSTYSLANLNDALAKDGTFVLNMDGNVQMAVSWWVSSKRTRSYPYARVYDSLSFGGKKTTIIPVMKDEGKDGDRDFLQWDTISLMSLLGVYVIISYYVTAERSSRYEHKITNQRFDVQSIVDELYSLMSYQSDALHWNLQQIDRVGLIAGNALAAYQRISQMLGVEMHSWQSAESRIKELVESKRAFMQRSRERAKNAQRRESMTIQPGERVSGTKATLTITNYLGGYYFFTCDEVQISDGRLYLIEAKHSERSLVPSLSDIKDGLLKMILLTNLKEVHIEQREYNPTAVLKLTSNTPVVPEKLTRSQVAMLSLLKEEAQYNQFTVRLNGVDVTDLEL